MVAPAALSAAQREELRELLLAEQAALRAVLSGSAERSAPVTLDQQSVGRVSRIDAIQQQQMARAGEQQARARLQQIGRALEKFSDDGYGWCESCEEPIAYARLAAKPETPYCLGCQAAQEQP